MNTWSASCVFICFWKKQGTLWRKIKYDWLKPGDYASWETLQKALEKILTSVGKELKIDFGELKIFTHYKACNWLFTSRQGKINGLCSQMY